jgi:Ca-activated chloride channel family protein
MNLTLSTWFARPALLACLSAVPMLAILFVFAWWRRRRAVARLGNVLAVRRLVLMRPAGRRWRTLCLLSGVSLLGLAAAGPQWGREYGMSRAAGDDLLVVLDLSRSMDAEQPSRKERAVRLLRDLADTLELRGNRRVALVVFAAEPRLLFPLTQDYDHFRHSLKQIGDDDLPPLLPATASDTAFQSGTRFGAALRLAVQAHDLARSGKQAILLLSDGDDPAADDEEWLQGVLEARARAIRIITVGVGDPEQARTIPDGADVLRYQGEVVRSRLNEPLLQEMARRTGGAYLPAHTYALPLGTLVQNLLEQHPPADDLLTSDALPAYRQVYTWLLGPGLLLLVVSLLINEGPGPAKARRPGRTAPTLAYGIGVLLVSAAALPDADPLILQGNAAFAAGDFEGALKFYDQAERGAIDPGMVAFNRAAACYRLGRFAEAVTGYRQCLEDDQMPIARRTRARYDLGTALLRQSDGTSAALLRQAVAALRSCLAEPGLDPDLHADARHNLELAQLLWLKARAANPEQRSDGAEDHRPEQKSSKLSGPNSEKKNSAEPGPKGGPEIGEPGDDDKGAPAEGKKNRVKSGALQVLPDAPQVVPLPPPEAEAQLDSIAERIIQERRSYWQKSVKLPKGTRNW